MMEVYLERGRLPFFDCFFDFTDDKKYVILPIEQREK